MENDNKPIMATGPKEIEFKEKSTEAVSIIQKQIRNQKKEIIRQILKEKKMLKILRLIDKKARFPKLLVEVHPDGKETFYADNDTLKGLKLVTFYQIEEPTIDGNEFKTRLFYY